MKTFWTAQENWHNQNYSMNTTLQSQHNDIEIVLSFKQRYFAEVNICLEMFACDFSAGHVWHNQHLNSANIFLCNVLPRANDQIFKELFSPQQHPKSGVKMFSIFFRSFQYQCVVNRKLEVRCEENQQKLILYIIVKLLFVLCELCKAVGLFYVDNCTWKKVG